MIKKTTSLTELKRLAGLISEDEAMNDEARELELFIMNGPNLPIAKKNFENLFLVSLSNLDSSIPGFDLTSVYLNRETTDLKVVIGANELGDYYPTEADRIQYPQAGSTKEGKIINIQTARGDKPIFHTLIVRPQ